jgi:uncharacterized protein YdaU (DUF1376 family)
MSGLPWYKRDPNAFIEGCVAGNLTLEEVGAYTLLIDEMYRRGGPLLDDPRHGSALLRCDVRVWYRIRSALIRKGKVYATSGGHLSNLRVEQELRRQYDMREQKARAGRVSATTRAEKQSELDSAIAQLRCNSSVTEAQLSPSFARKSLKTNTTASTGVGPSVGVDIDKEHVLPTATVGTGVPTSIDEPLSEALKEYNLAAQRAGWTKARLPISSKRRRMIRARLRDGGMAAWMAQIAEAEAQPFLAGDNDRGWRMDVEFFASESGRVKIMEGKYRRAPKPGAAFDAASAIRIMREHGYRHPQLTDEMIEAVGARL